MNTGPPEEETKSALEVLSENGALVEEGKVAMDLKTLVPPPLPPPQPSLGILSGPSTKPTTYTESPTLIREAKQIQELLSEYKEDSRNIQRQVNRLAELLEMSGLQASFNSNNVTLPAPSLRNDTPVRPGLMMLESTPGLIKGATASLRIARSARHLAQNDNAGSLTNDLKHSSRMGFTKRADTCTKTTQATSPNAFYPMSNDSNLKRVRDDELENVHNVSAEAVMEEMRQFVVTPARERLLREAKIQQAMAEMKHEVGLR